MCSNPYSGNCIPRVYLEFKPHDHHTDTIWYSKVKGCLSTTIKTLDLFTKGSSSSPRSYRFQFPWGYVWPLHYQTLEMEKFLTLKVDKGSFDGSMIISSEGGE